jgi:hypothetical protein
MKIKLKISFKNYTYFLERKIFVQKIKQNIYFAFQPNLTT